MIWNALGRNTLGQSSLSEAVIRFIILSLYARNKQLLLNERNKNITLSERDKQLTLESLNFRLVTLKLYDKILSLKSRNPMLSLLKYIKPCIPEVDPTRVVNISLQTRNNKLSLGKRKTVFILFKRSNKINMRSR